LYGVLRCRVQIKNAERVSGKAIKLSEDTLIFENATKILIYEVVEDKRKRFCAPAVHVFLAYGIEPR
jgi:hypothetical protein